MKLISWIIFAVFPATLSLPARAGIFKENPVPPTPFLKHPQAMNPDPARAPFDRVWMNPSTHAWDRVKGFDRVVVMPVNTDYLKAIPGRQADVDKMAAYMREQFQSEFAKAGKSRGTARHAGKTLQVELALVRLKPTNVPGNVVSTGAGVLVPGLNIVGSQFTHGNIAFEAKVRNGQTGELLAEYADSQKDKMALLTFRDYSSNAHSRRAVQDWARQMQQLVATPANHKVQGAMRLTLNPF